MVAWSLWRMSLPSRGTGQEGMMRKECEKGNPSRLHIRGGVAFRVEEVPSTPITATGEG